VSRLSVQGPNYFHDAHAFFFYPSPLNYLDRLRIVMQMMSKRIETGTPEGDAMGFSESLFTGWLETRDNNRLYLHYIISRRRNEGNTQALLRQWLLDGYDVRVVMPRPIMQHILKKYYFIPSREYFPDEYEDEVEVWIRAGTLQPGGAVVSRAEVSDPECSHFKVIGRAMSLI
jgi:hypothetical protein